VARILHESTALLSQGSLPHARFRQVRKAPRMAGPDSAVAPVSGTSRLRAAVEYTATAQQRIAQWLFADGPRL